jgi:hypothetical protein
MAGSSKETVTPRADGTLGRKNRGLNRRRKGLLFVNKKKQKNFFHLGRAGFSASGPEEQKFFAPLFFKKAAAFLFPDL